MMKITGLSHLFKWENLHNWWLTKYFFAPLYVQLHKPEQPSITYLTLALTFSMRLKSILKIHQLSKNLGVCTCVVFVFKDSLFVLLCRKGFLRSR